MTETLTLQDLTRYDTHINPIVVKHRNGVEIDMAIISIHRNPVEYLLITPSNGAVVFTARTLVECFSHLMNSEHVESVFSRTTKDVRSAPSPSSMTAHDLGKA